ncbi:TonB-dependent hemoglobin/transferrin/lactoferrin family receptor [Shewanella sp. Isolate13]|uniref:TonB-dependent hemoglobin/transferrin/lactoferrin family receptor n=1 Tax=Shewanella sp. Isolate13 TaxID=2908531 RepID=UPI001EFE651E|nr:TonB-dependent hemoglobin/transferrin/lactoferrin family receptor [Shewanella sp. Isolate13]MCG9728396.1 TonB-dependent hemoglobin/transferrin/lactoferrin family receptor [Shewanella sp. Isolate13]
MKQAAFPFSAIALAVMMTLPVWAGSPDETLVIVGSRSAAAISDVSGSVAAITSDDLARQLASNLQDAIKAEPGVEMAGTGKFGLGSFNIRGMSEDRVKLLIDGIEQPVFFKASNSSPHTDVINQYSGSVELDTLIAIEINKNSASSLYGSDAIGGAVMLRTKAPDDLLQGQTQALIFNAGYSGANQGFKNTWEYAYDAGSWQGMAIYTFRDESETQSHGDGKDVIGVERGLADPADYLSHNLLMKAVTQLTDEQNLSLTAEFYQRDGDTDLWSMEGYLVPDRRGGPDTIYTNNRLESQQSRWRLTLAHEWHADSDWFDTSSWQLSWQQAVTDNDNYRTKNTDCLDGCKLVRNREDKNLQLHGQFDKLINWQNVEQELVYGLSVVNSAFDSFYQDVDLGTGQGSNTTTTMPNATAVRTGLFAKQQLRFDTLPLQWDLGLRYDDYRTNPDGDLKEHQSDVLTYNTGLMLRLNEQLSSYVSITTGYRAPSLYDLYYRLDLPHVIILPNENLEAETSTSYEIGMRWFGDEARAELAIFYNDYKDFIDSVTDDSGWPSIMQYQNVGKAWISGVELKADWDLEQWLDGAYVKTGMAWAEGENRDTGRALDSVSPFNASLTLGYDDPSGTWGAELFAKYAAEKSGDDWTEEDNLTAPSYLYLDLTSYWQVNDSLKLQLGVMNLTDEKYWLYGNLGGLQPDPQLNPDRLTQPRRNLNAALQYRF